MTAAEHDSVLLKKETSIKISLKKTDQYQPLQLKSHACPTSYRYVKKFPFWVLNKTKICVYRYYIANILVLLEHNRSLPTS